MLQIGAHQQRQWAVVQLPRPEGALLDGRAGLESVACRGKRENWITVFWSRSSSDIERGRRCNIGRRRQGVVVMESASVEPRPFDVDNLRGSRRISSLNSKINKASKWVVVAFVVGGLLWRHDEHALWFIVGSVVNGGFCKSLKSLINENRPATAEGVKGGPGMPSSHGQGFTYLATYVSLALLSWQGLHIWTAIASFGILLSAVYLSWLRIAEGLHTPPQVLVGSILGSATAVFWLCLWKGGVEAAVSSSHLAKLVLYMSFVAASGVCYFISVKDWQVGEP